MQNTFSPKQELLSRLKYWWIVFVLAILGSAIGWGISALLKPQYEASAILSLAVDFSKIGMPTDIEQDQIIELVGDICKSGPVTDKVTAQFAAISTDDFQRMSSIERRNMQWVMKIRSSDAVLAANLADVWQQTAYDEIITAYQHAILVDAYADKIKSLTRCIEHITPQQPESAYCPEKSIQDLQAELEAYADKMKIEQQLSNGISPAISISALEPAVIPVHPVFGVKSFFILAGGGIGLVIGLLVMMILPFRKPKNETM